MNAPQDFDWVSARADCSLLPVFLKLESECGTDVDTMNERLMDKGSQARFLLQHNDANTQFWVFGNVDSSLVVKFILHADRIEVVARDATLAVTLTLNAEGKCKLKVDGAGEFDQWQLRKVALENLFFSR